MLDLLGNLPAILTGIGVLIAGAFGLRWKSKRDGKKEAYDEMQEQDRAQADGIRKRVRDADGVRGDERKYRD